MPLRRAAALAIALVALTAPVGGQDPGQGEVSIIIDGADGRRVQVRAPRRTREPEATAVIRGRVFAGDTGVPLRRALVSAQGGGRPVVAQTDADGRFEVRVPPGRWSLAAAKAGYVTLRLGQHRAFESVSPVELRPGQRMDNADFVLPRGAAIMGRVFDEVGDPVLDARVRVLRYQMVRGRKQLSSAGIAVTTDDRGVYRLYGLAPGEYYVSATAETRPLDRGDEQQMKYAPTYYPGSTDVVGAQRITVDVGDEQTNVNFSLLPVRTARVTGIVVDASGAPVGPGNVTLTTVFDVSDAGVPLGASTRLEADGSFEIGDVVPGSYTLIARSRSRPQGGRGAAAQSIAYMPLVVPGDISDVVVTATGGATLSGTIAAAGGREPPRGNVRIVAQPLSSAVGFGRLTANATTGGGGFTLEGLIGPVMLRADQVPQGWMVERIEVNGTDVTDSYVEFRGTESALARVVLTNEIPEISGRVVADRSVGPGSAQPPAPGSRVVIFPADPSKWRFPSRYVHAVRTDDTGAFTVRELPPYDRYLAVAVDYLEEDEAGDADFLQAIRSSATSFSLAGGESKVIELKLVKR